MCCDNPQLERMMVNGEEGWYCHRCHGWIMK